MAEKKPKRKNALGRGLGALLDDAPASTPAAAKSLPLMSLL